MADKGKNCQLRGSQACLETDANARLWKSTLLGSGRSHRAASGQLGPIVRIAKHSQSGSFVGMFSLTRASILFVSSVHYGHCCFIDCNTVAS